MGRPPDPPARLEFETLSINIVYLLLGIFGWEYCQSLQVERALVFGRLAFRSPLIPYMLGRACLLVFLVCLAAVASPYTGITCIPGTLTMASLEDIALGCSSTNFLIRTWVIWKDSRFVHALLLLLAAGQWAMLVVDVVNIRLINIQDDCVIYFDYPQMNAVTFVYTTCFDLIVFVLSVVGLSNQRSESPLKRRLRVQGILYIAAAGIAYIPPMVFSLLNNTAVFIPVCNIAATISTIVSSRAVRSLLFLDADADHQSEENDVAFTTQISTPESIP